MPTSQDILQFHFSPTALTVSAQKIIPVSLNRLNEHRVDKLNKITDKVGVSSFTFTGNHLIPQVYRKFKKGINDKIINFERRELRTLTYALSYSEQNATAIFKDYNELDYALALLNNNWRDSYLIGLVDCFLNNWETQQTKSLDCLEKFIWNRLEAYAGNRSSLISFKKNKQFFNRKNGNIILGDNLVKLNRPIQEATKKMTVPDSWIRYPYFSKVIVTYYERSLDGIAKIIDNLDEILIQHDSSVTNKRLISKIIIQIHALKSQDLLERIKGMALKHIGDPENIAAWAPFNSATDTEKVELIKARSILNEWIAQQFINVFFNVCINDERRKKFWLQFSSKISSFKVYGPLRTRSTLKRDQRITEYVDARFEKVQSNRDISAFILYIGDYMLIEFSNEGYAFYAYKTNSSYRPILDHQLNSVDDLRNSSMPMLVQSSEYYDYFNEEGRLTHRDGNQTWETRFTDWINHKIFK